MSEERIGVLYDDTPMWAKMAAWLLLGIGGIVLVPLALLNRTWWLLPPAVPFLLAGLALLQIHVRIVVEAPGGVVCVTNSLWGLKLRERRYPPSVVLGLDLHRVAGDERHERASDTWYLRLRLHTTVRTLFGQVRPHTKTHILGKYDSELSALEAQIRLEEILHARPSG